MTEKTIEILGTEYRIEFKKLGDEECDAYCDPTERLIAVREDNINEIGDFEELQRRILRHEIIHAFLFESGLAFNWQHAEKFGHDETMVDWIAVQAPKIFKVFKELDII